jgi:flagellar motility protein MotE (MotC chaperone)
MSASKKPNSAMEFALFDDALIDSILLASDTEFQEEMLESGIDISAAAAHFDALLAAAKAACALQKLKDAQRAVQAFQATRLPIDENSRVAARTKLDAARTGKVVLPSGIMLAARKGGDASSRDLDSMSEDYAELEALEQAELSQDMGE